MGTDEFTFGEDGEGEEDTSILIHPVFDLEQARRDIAAGKVRPARSTKEILESIGYAPSVLEVAEHRKFRGSTMRRLSALKRQSDVLVIVTVASDGHVPDDLTLRSRIGPTVITGSVSVDALPNVLDDPQVVSLEISSPLHANARQPEA
jgi:hypothetical protein